MNNTPTLSVTYYNGETETHGVFECRGRAQLPDRFANVREALEAAKPLSLQDRRPHICWDAFVQTHTFRKGDTAYWVRSHKVVKIQIQSWGRKEGTATRTENGQFVRHSMNVRLEVVFATREDAQAWADETGPAYEFNRLSGSIDCAVSNLPNVLAQYRPRCEAEIAAKRAALAAL